MQRESKEFRYKIGSTVNQNLYTTTVENLKLDSQYR